MARARVIDQEKKVCPECGYQFKGNGFDGIDAPGRFLLVTTFKQGIIHADEIKISET